MGATDTRAADVAALRARLRAVIAQHQSGAIESAIAGYLEVLREDPRQFDALRLLAVALRANGRLEEAAGQFDRAVEVRGDFAEAWRLRGENLAQLGRQEEALASLERALVLQPADANAWNSLGLQQQSLGRHEAALESLERALSLAPGVAHFWNNRGVLLDAARRTNEALASYDRALACDGTLADAWINRSRTLQELRRHEEALASVDRALQLAPRLGTKLAAAWMARAEPLRALGRIEEAGEASQRALDIDPDLAPAWALRGAALHELGQREEAARCLQRALALAPQDAAVRFNLSMLDLAAGRLEAGWEGYEFREAKTGMDPRAAPIWSKGEALARRSLALHCEQGLGDTLQFCRYAALLARSGTRVILVVPASLQRLLESLGDGVRVLTSGDAMPPFDRQCALLSVPHRLDTRLESIPASVPYLAAPAALVGQWRRRLDALAGGGPGAEGGVRVRRMGLAFAGSAGHVNDRLRSLPLEQLAMVIESLPRGRFEWHLLQKDVPAADEPLLARLGVHDHREALHDFCETAALASCMDGVVSVDTSIAHLAGALGLPLHLMLPANPDWRWLLERQDSPWYPSARLHRQAALGDWQAPLDALRAALQESMLTATAGERAGMGDTKIRGANAPTTPGVSLAAAPVTANEPDWRLDERLARLLAEARAAPGDARAQFHLGLRYLTLGRFEAGWDCYEARLRVPALYTPMPPGGSYWDGSTPLAGRTLLLCQEQGLGDAIQFFRFAPMLAAHGAKVVLGVAPPLARLAATVPGVQAVVAGTGTVPAFDLKCLLLSVAQRLGIDAQSIQAQVPYLAAPAETALAWRERVQAGTAGRRRFRVGLVASGSTTHAGDAQRSIPLAQMAQLCRLAPEEGDADAWEWHLLQNELRPTDAAALAQAPIAWHGAQLHDLAETAALAGAMDAVVSVDTAVAHLAGALGRPLVLLLPEDPDWRWGLRREDSAWYPTARLVRLAANEGWEAALARAAGALRAIRAARDGAGGAAAHDAPGSNAPLRTLRVSDVRPLDLAALLNTAAQAHKSGQRSAAIAAYREVLAHDAGCFDALRLLGAALFQEGRAQEAVRVLEQALALRADCAESWLVLANCRASLGDGAAALADVDRALALDTADSLAWEHRAKLCHDLARFDEARANLEQALWLRPQAPALVFRRGLLRLLQGELPQAWDDFEARRHVPELATAPLPGVALWDGTQELEGRCLLLTCEQGLGDTIHFARFAPLLAARGARVVLGVQPPLKRLLAGLPGEVQVVTQGDRLPAIDLQCPLLSVAHRLQMRLEAVPGTTPFLRAERERVDAWQARLGPRASGATGRLKPRIGIACSGSRTHVNDAHRSIPLERFAQLLGDGAQWHLVQNELSAADEPWLERLGLHDHRHLLTDMAETAALLSCLDAVISVDTSVAHLAGALGRPLILLLPANPDWRWQLGREDCAWYPSARLLRQPQPGDWETPLRQLSKQLAELSPALVKADP
jgi:tetratricopeptide (TPR) repeat protein